MDKTFVVFDLDGTLADCEHRRHLLDTKPPQWDAFMAGCSFDKPLQHTINLMRHFLRHPDEFHVEIWSGRSTTVLTQTLSWLAEYAYEWCFEKENFVKPEKLQLRPIKDYTPDLELKRRWLYEAEERLGKKPDIVFDDRQCVVDMWREEGIQCYQVAPGDFDVGKKFEDATDERKKSGVA